MQNFIQIGQAVWKLRSDHYHISVFRCNLSVCCINSMYSITKMVCCIALKFVVHAHWHVLRLLYKFRGDICVISKVIHKFAFFVVFPLLQFRRLVLVPSWVHQCGYLYSSMIHDSIINHTQVKFHLNNILQVLWHNDMLPLQSLRQE